VSQKLFSTEDPAAPTVAEEDEPVRLQTTAVAAEVGPVRLQATAVAAEGGPVPLLSSAETEQVEPVLCDPIMPRSDNARDNIL
jgi:hypothetical protein